MTRTERDRMDELAWEIYHGMGTIALGLGETVQRQAVRDVLNAALEAAGYVVVERARVEKAEARMKEFERTLSFIATISLNSHGDIHGITADHWRNIFHEVQDAARAALGDTND
jgi:hypothetical protein